MQPDSLTTRTDTLSGGPGFASGQDSLPVRHGFSVWRIYQQMPGCTPQQLDSAVQANLPVRERVLSTRPDTLSLPGLPGRKGYEVTRTQQFDPQQYAGFFRDNTTLHPELPYRSFGESAVSLPYMLRNDNLVTGSLLVCLILLVYAVNKTRRQLVQQTKKFFFAPRQRSRMFAAETSIESSSRRYLYLQLCILGGVMIFAYSQNKYDNFLGQLSPRMLLLTYLAGFFVCILGKRLLISFVNWVLFPKNKQKTWNDIYSYIVSVESIVFFPLALAYVYFQLSYETALSLFIFIFFIIKILLAFKTYYIFFRKSYGLFHLFVYLCALEVMPLLAIWKTLAIVTDSLIVKY